jgi:erythromycin esterase-like protein
MRSTIDVAVMMFKLGMWMIAGIVMLVAWLVAENEKRRESPRVWWTLQVHERLAV